MKRRSIKVIDDKIVDKFRKKRKIVHTISIDCARNILKFYFGKLSILYKLPDWNHLITKNIVKSKIDCLSNGTITHYQSYKIDKLIHLYDEIFEYTQGLKKLPNLVKIKKESLKLDFDMLYYHVKFIQSDIADTNSVVKTINRVISLKKPELFKLIMDITYERFSELSWWEKPSFNKISTSVALTNDYKMYDAFLEGFKRWGLNFSSFISIVIKHYMSEELIKEWITKNLQKIQINTTQKQIKEIGWTLLLCQYEICESQALDNIMNKREFKIQK